MMFFRFIRSKPIAWMGSGALLYFSFFSGLYACNVPVFRYALEMWTTDVYRVVVYCRGEPEDDLFGLLQSAAENDETTINYAVEKIDIATAGGEDAVDLQNIPELPWLELYYPEAGRVRGLAWGGPFDDKNVKRLFISPVRSALARGILDGDAAMWLLLQCGDEQKDERALEILEKSLARANAELKIPETGVDIDGNPIAVGDFRDYEVHFGLLSLSRDDPDETILVNTLLGSESDLVFYDEPMVFPVFGRGRALYAIVGKGIKETLIYETCESIIGWCSCEVKAQNPGFDLLISADWSNPVGGIMVKETELPPLIGLSAFAESMISQKTTEKMAADNGEIVNDSVSNTAAETGEMAMASDRDTIATVIFASKPDGDMIDVSGSLSDSTGGQRVNPSRFAARSPFSRNMIFLIAIGFVSVLTASFIIKSKRNIR